MTSDALNRFNNLRAPSLLQFFCIETRSPIFMHTQRISCAVYIGVEVVSSHGKVSL